MTQEPQTLLWEDGATPERMRRVAAAQLMVIDQQREEIERLKVYLANADARADRWYEEMVKLRELLGEESARRAGLEVAA
jgi:hypothetical protein